MLKFDISGRNYWVGYGDGFGIVVFDPIRLINADNGQVMLYVVNRHDCSLFAADLVRTKLVHNRHLDRELCEKCLSEYFSGMCDRRAETKYIASIEPE